MSKSHMETDTHVLANFKRILSGRYGNINVLNEKCVFSLFQGYLKVMVMKSWWDMIELIKVNLFKGYDFKKWVKLTE